MPASGRELWSAQWHLRWRHANALERMNRAWSELERDPCAADWLSGATDCEDLDQISQLFDLWKAVEEIRETGRELVTILDALLNQPDVFAGCAAEIRRLRSFYEEIDCEVQDDAAIVDRVVVRVEIV